MKIIQQAVILAMVALGMAADAAAAADRKQKPGAPEGAQLEVQILLDRLGFSPGEIDGKGGANTRRALLAYQTARKIPATGGVAAKGSVDGAALQALRRETAVEPLRSHTLTAADVAGPFVKSIPADMMEKSKLPALGYSSVLEALGEQFHCAPALLQSLNPKARFGAGEAIRVPNIGAPPAGPPAGAVTVEVVKSASALTVRDSTNRVLFYAPVTQGSAHDPLPLGTWKVTGVAKNPTFLYNPDLFWDADPAHAKAKIPAGPNNPVGVCWIDLNKKNYGLHGTPEPSKIGYTQSHGCVRMTNWDVLRVAALVKPGVAVIFKEK